MRHATQLLAARTGAMAFGVGFVAKDLAILGAVDCKRDGICAKRAPFPGPCQAFVDKPSGPRIVRTGRLGVYRLRMVDGRTMGTFDMAVNGRVDERATSQGVDELLTKVRPR